MTGLEVEFAAIVLGGSTVHVPADTVFPLKISATSNLLTMVMLEE
jgi:hypothetical protein